MDDDPRATERFIRVIGRRQRPRAGEPPSAEAREALSRMAAYLTRVPKGIFIYATHEAANQDRDRWTVEAVVQRHQNG